MMERRMETESLISKLLKFLLTNCLLLHYRSLGTHVAVNNFFLISTYFLIHNS